MGERRTVGGTAWYQLNHATVKVGVKCFRVVTWFGVCSYRKLKVSPDFVVVSVRFVNMIWRGFVISVRKIGSLASLKGRATLRLIIARMGVLFGMWILGFMVLTDSGSFAC